MRPIITDSEQRPEIRFVIWIKQLLNSVNELGDEISWHLIIDPNSHDDLPKRLAERETGIYIWPLYLNTYLKKMMVVGPHMVRLRVGSQLCHYLLNMLETVPAGIIVGSRAGHEDELYEHLQKILEYQTPEGRQAIFRYYDPRMLYGIKTYHDQTIKDYIMHRSLFFEAWEPGRAHHIYIEPSKGPFDFPDDYVLPEELMDHLWEKAHIHSIIGGLSGAPGQILREKSLPDSYALIASAGDIIRKYGYSSYEDLALCAAITALMGLEVWARKDIQEALAEPNISLYMALEEIGDKLI